MNRQQRRARERRAAEYDSRKTFSKLEVERMNDTAYMLGVQNTLQAAKEVFGLGRKRLKRLTERLKKIEREEIEPYADRGKRID